MTETMNRECLLILLSFWKHPSKQNSVIRPRVNFYFTPLIAEETWPYTTVVAPSLAMV